MEEGALFYYFPPEATAGDVDIKKLRNRYYVQLAPDGAHLVQGMLHQGERPRTGSWLQVGKIEKNFSKRYFVQSTGFNTLVPGSLVMGDRLPGERWKEVRKGGGMFHKLVPTGSMTIESPVTEPLILMDASHFLMAYINPAMEMIHPGIDLMLEPVRYKVFYFDGTLDDLNNDVSQLIEFGEGAAFSLQNLGVPPGENYVPYIYSNVDFYTVVIYLEPFITNGDYSIVFAVMDSSLPEGEDVVQYYIFVETYIYKTPPPPI